MFSSFIYLSAPPFSHEPSYCPGSSEPGMRKIGRREAHRAEIAPAGLVLVRVERAVTVRADGDRDARLEPGAQELGVGAAEGLRTS